jgi:hypothetical protein
VPSKKPTAMEQLVPSNLPPASVTTGTGMGLWLEEYKHYQEAKQRAKIEAYAEAVVRYLRVMETND